MSKPSIALFLARPERSDELGRRLRSRGFDVTHYNDPKASRVPVVPVDPRFPHALARVLFRTNHDAYFTSFSHGPAICLYLNRLLRRKPYVFNAVSVKWEMFREQSKTRAFSGFYERRLHPFLLERTFAGASRIVTNSRFLERTIGEFFPQYRSRVCTIYNGIDFEQAASGRRTSVNGGGPEEFVLLFVTTLNFEGKAKGLEVVLDAFERIRAEDRRARLVVAGKVSNQKLKTWATELVTSKPYADAVTLRFNDPAVPDLLASADLFLYATRADSNDSLPRALLEAQAAGLPAVTTATTGCPEIVEDGSTGLVVPYDGRAMAEAALSLMGDRERRRQMASAAPESIRRRFDWERMADGYAEVFRDVITGIG